MVRAPGAALLQSIDDRLTAMEAWIAALEAADQRQRELDPVAPQPAEGGEGGCDADG